MPKQKTKPSISEMVEQFEGLELPDQITVLKEIQNIVADKIVAAKQHVADFEKLNGNHKP